MVQRVARVVQQRRRRRGGRGESGKQRSDHELSAGFAGLNHEAAMVGKTFLVKCLKGSGGGHTGTAKGKQFGMT